MKRCPTCKREFEDSLTYCLEDGSPLVSETRPDSDATLVSPAPPAPQPQPPATQFAQYQPAGAVVSAPSKRRVWPWVLGGLVVLFLFVVIIVVAAVAFRVIKNSNTNRHVVIDVPTPEPSGMPTPSPEESASPTEAPTDEDVVLTQLTDLEKRWTQANIDGDKNALQQILAEEYSSGDPPHSKQQYIDELKPDSAVKSWNLEDVSVDLSGDRATATGYLRQQTADANEVYSFTDDFVWRDGRWQATGSRTVRVK